VCVCVLYCEKIAACNINSISANKCGVKLDYSRHTPHSAVFTLGCQNIRFRVLLRVLSGSHPGCNPALPSTVPQSLSQTSSTLPHSSSYSSVDRARRYRLGSRRRSGHAVKCHRGRAGEAGTKCATFPQMLAGNAAEVTEQSARHAFRLEFFFVNWVGRR